MIQIIDIINYIYCPRYIYYQYKLEIPQYEEKYYKVLKGREIHEQKKIRNKNYLRKKIGATQKYITPYLTNGKLRGIPDEVIKLNNNKYTLIEYKYSRYQGVIYKPIMHQITAYALLIEHNYSTQIDFAYLIYVRSNNKLIKVNITEQNKKLVIDAINNIYNILENDIFPPPSSTSSKCTKCTYRNICPK